MLGDPEPPSDRYADLPPVAVDVPDDARELARDLQALQRGATLGPPPDMGAAPPAGPALAPVRHRRAAGRDRAAVRGLGHHAARRPGLRSARAADRRPGRRAAWC